MTAPAGWVDPNPPNGSDPRTNRILAISGAALTAVVLTALVVVVVLHKSAADDAQPRRGVMTLTAANAPTADPFMPSVVVTPTQISDTAAGQIASLATQLPQSAARGVRVVQGLQPGLYGVAGQSFPCDVAEVANRLDASRDKAAVWAQALGLSVQQVPHYLNTLTPVALTIDTWVTAYLYTDGRARGLQTVLQAGTAVLIDPAGVPRLHCASGDPLSPSANLNAADLNTDGKGWSGFEVRNVAAIAYGGAPSGPTTVTEFSVLDLGTGERATRKAGGTFNLPENPSVQLPDPVAMNVAPKPER
ncbi:Uncharacterised protein [Mycobacteroides abscessus subsp. abscessus]|nr:Uncharacterised protein [Mycobacteroides abscessus subsp. abscessus]